MEKEKIDKFELSKKIEDLDFIEKFNLCTFRSPDFYLNLTRGNFFESTSISIDDDTIYITTYEKGEISDKKVFENVESIVNRIKKIVFRKKRTLINFSLKLSSSYVIKHSVENSYSNSLFLKINGVIINIHNGSINNLKTNLIIKQINKIISDLYKYNY